MAKVQGTVIVDVENCKGCEVCVASCPFKVLAMSSKVNSKGYHFVEMINPDLCTGCTSCAITCPDSCLTVYRQKR